MYIHTDLQQRGAYDLPKVSFRRGLRSTETNKTSYGSFSRTTRADRERVELVLSCARSEGGRRFCALSAVCDRSVCSCGHCGLALIRCTMMPRRFNGDVSLG